MVVPERTASCDCKILKAQATPGGAGLGFQGTVAPEPKPAPVGFHISGSCLPPPMPRQPRGALDGFSPGPRLRIVCTPGVEPPGGWQRRPVALSISRIAPSSPPI